MMDLVLVDGPNLFGSVGRSLEANLPAESIPRLGEYLSDWFDFDRLVGKTLGGTQPVLGTVLIHSNRHLGKGKHRLSAERVAAFWGRQASRPNTSSLVVDVPGDQGETFQSLCSNCGKETVAKHVGEKGVDSTMIVYMFETSHQWQSLCIFSRDADFVPAVWALRRRGKVVLVVAENQDSISPLGRACQSFLSLPVEFMLADFSAFELLRKGGVLDTWLAEVSSVDHRTGVKVSGDNAIEVIHKGNGSGTRVQQLRADTAKLPNFEYVLATGVQTVDSGRESKAVFRIDLSFPPSRVVGEPAWLSYVVKNEAEVPNPMESNG